MRKRFLVLGLFLVGSVFAAMVGLDLMERLQRNSAPERNSMVGEETTDIQEPTLAVSDLTGIDVNDPVPLSEIPFASEPEALAASEDVSPATPAWGHGAGIEGTVSAKGRLLAGARVYWRPAHDSGYVPLGWTPALSGGGFIQEGVTSDFFEPAPVGQSESAPVRLGGGYMRYDTALARTVKTVPGERYELRLFSRFVHERYIGALLSEGAFLNRQIGRYGIDLTGQDKNHSANTIEYHSVVDGPNNLWREFRTEFQAKGERTAIWLHAAQSHSDIGLLWFDGLKIRQISSGKEESLLARAEKPDEDAISGYVDSVLTGGEGYFRIAPLDPGDYDLFAVYPGEGSARRERVRVQVGEVTTASLSLFGGGVIRGKVTENITSKPIDGAVVTVSLSVDDRTRIPVEGLVDSLTTRSGSNGQFYFRNLLPGIRYHVSVEAPGYVPPPPGTAIPDGPELTLALTPAGRITGIVVVEGMERRVSGAIVRAFRRNTRVAVTETGADGTFELRGLEPADYRLVAEKNGSLSALDSSAGFRVRLDSPHDSAQAVLAIPLGGRIEGQVRVHDENRPVEGLDIIFSLLGYLEEGTDESSIQAILSGILHNGTADSFRRATFRPHFVARTDAAGRFEIEGVGAGIWTPSLRSLDYQMGDGIGVRVTPGQTTKVELQIGRYALIEGVVTSSDRGPVEGAAIWPRSIGAGDGPSYVTLFVELGLTHSGPDGSFALRVPCSQSRYDLVATLENGAMGTATGILPGQPGVEIVLEDHGSIGGRIRFESGRPLVGAKVTALGGELTGGHWWRDGITDGEGRFKVTQLPEGVYDLDFGSRWPELKAQYGPVRVGKGQAFNGLDLVIPGKGSLRGSVRFESNEPVPGVIVTATRLDSEGMPKWPQHWMTIQPNPPDLEGDPELRTEVIVHQTVTDAGGRYAMTDILEGRYRVTVEYPGFLSPPEGSPDGEVHLVTIDDGTIDGIDFRMARD